MSKIAYILHRSNIYKFSFSPKSKSSNAWISPISEGIAPLNELFAAIVFKMIHKRNIKRLLWWRFENNLFFYSHKARVVKFPRAPNSEGRHPEIWLFATFWTKTTSTKLEIEVIFLQLIQTPLNLHARRSTRATSRPNSDGRVPSSLLLSTKSRSRWQLRWQLWKKLT